MRTREQKAQEIRRLNELLSHSRGVAVTAYKGLNMKQMNELRARIAEYSAKFMVVKNTLARIAAKDTPYESLLADLEGPNALLLLGEDAPGALKAAISFARDNKAFEPDRGFVEGSPLDKEGLKAYSELPTAEEVRSMFVGVLNAPLAKLVGVLNAPARDMVGVMAAYEDKLGAGEGAA